VMRIRPPFNPIPSHQIPRRMAGGGLRACTDEALIAYHAMPYSYTHTSRGIRSASPSARGGSSGRILAGSGRQLPTAKLDRLSSVVVVDVVDSSALPTYLGCGINTTPSLAFTHTDTHTDTRRIPRPTDQPLGPDANTTERRMATRTRKKPRKANDFYVSFFGEE